MHTAWSVAAAFAVAFSFVLPASSQAPAGAADAPRMAQMPADEEPAFLDLRVDGGQVNRGVRRVLSELHWHKDLDTAADQARRLGRPILWLQLLGDLRGFA